MKRPIEDIFEDGDYIVTGEWRKIPGFNGAYEINEQGDVRSWLLRGKNGYGKRRKEPVLLKPFFKAGTLEVRKRKFVNLRPPEGHPRSITVMRLMVDVWLGGCPKGKMPYQINGDLDDYSINNIGFATRQELGILTGAEARSMKVEKINRYGEVVAVYPSARAAGRANFLSYQAVIDRCRGQIKDPFRYDDCTYRYQRD